MSTLKIAKSYFVYQDAPGTKVPRQRLADWTTNAEVANVMGPSAREIELLPEESLTLVDQTVAVTVTGRAFDFELAPGKTDVYRLLWLGTGGAPGFRTERTLGVVATNTIVVEVQPNDTVTFTGPASWADNVVTGDVIWIPGSEEAFSTPFSIANTDFWQVLTRAGTVVTAKRPDSFYGTSETVILTTGSIRAFSGPTTGLRVGDLVALDSPIPTLARGSYTLVRVTSEYIDVASVPALPTATAMTFDANSLEAYRRAKRLLIVEADQRCTVEVNGAAPLEIVPWVAGDMASSASFVFTGPCYSAVITNKAAVAARVVTLSVE